MPHRPPKGHPKVTKWSPRGPQGLPKSSQGPPKDHPRVPNTSKMSLKGSRDSPTHQKGCPEGTIWTPFCPKIRSLCFFLGAGGRGACAFRSAAPCRRQVPACLKLSQVGFSPNPLRNLRILRSRDHRGWRQPCTIFFFRNIFRLQIRVRFRHRF